MDKYIIKIHNTNIVHTKEGVKSVNKITANDEINVELYHDILKNYIAHLQFLMSL